MAQVGDFVSSLFGNDNKDNGLDPELQRKQLELEQQQKAELDQQRKALEKQRIDLLRGRFSSPGSGGVPNETPANTEAAAANLFSRITGRNDQ